jgi:FixJ family two-component response regulator
MAFTRSAVTRRKVSTPSFLSGPMVWYGAIGLPAAHGSRRPRAWATCSIALDRFFGLSAKVLWRMTKEAPELPPVVFVIDDDHSLRNALTNLFRSVGLEAETFGSAPEFLQSELPDVPSCLVLDIRLPGPSGLDFQSTLVQENIHIPIIFMTGHGDIPMTVRALKAGAVDFLTKPFRDQEMLDAVSKAIEHDRKRRKDHKAMLDLRALFNSLTPREQEVLALVTGGLLNKQIAAEIGLAEITVKIHRGHLMKKMGARSVAELVRMAEILGVRRTKP